MEILIATHKEKCLLQNSIFKPIQTNIGHTKTIIDALYYFDNTEDNISTKNENYSEITALYWLWKIRKTKHF